MSAVHFYLAGGRPCVEEFARLDGLRQGQYQWLQDVRQLHGHSRAVIHFVEGWWLNQKSVGRALDLVWTLKARAECFEFQFIERSERELFGPDFHRPLYPWQEWSPNVYRTMREEHRKNTHGFAPPGQVYNSEGRLIRDPALEPDYPNLRWTGA